MTKNPNIYIHKLCICGERREKEGGKVAIEGDRNDCSRERERKRDDWGKLGGVVVGVLGIWCQRQVKRFQMLELSFSLFLKCLSSSITVCIYIYINI